MDEQPDPNEATPSAPVNVRIDARALIPDWQFLFLAFLLLASDGWSSSLWLKSGFLRAEIVEASIVFVRRMRACQWGRASGARSKKTSGLHTRSGYSSRASVLSAAERVAGGGGVRRVCRRVVQEVFMPPSMGGGWQETRSYGCGRNLWEADAAGNAQKLVER